MHITPESRPHFCPYYTRIWRAARCLKNATNFYVYARDSRFACPLTSLAYYSTPLVSYCTVLYRTPAVQKISRMSNPGIIPPKFSKFQIHFFELTATVRGSRWAQIA